MIKKTSPSFILIMYLIFFGHTMSFECNSQNIKDDSFITWERVCQDKTKSNEVRAYNCQKILKVIPTHIKDSSIRNALLSLSSVMRKENDLDSSIYYANQAILYGYKHTDNIALIKGYFNQAFSLKKHLKPIEAYESFTKGISIALKQGDSITAVRMLINTSDILIDQGDFSTAQIEATKALKILDKKQYPELASKLYNNLGNALQELMSYKSSNDAYQKAYTYTTNSNKKALIINNIANTYREQFLYNKSISTYKKAFLDTLLVTDSISKIRLIDNLGFTLFKAKKTGALSLLLEAELKRKVIKDYTGLNASKIHLCQYYYDSIPDKALRYAQEAYTIAKQIKSPDAKKEAISYIIRLKPNKELSDRYVTLTDSIQKSNLQIQIKFAGIQYQTEEKEKENNTLRATQTSQEVEIATKNRNNWLLGIGLFFAMIGIGIYSYFYKRNLKQKIEIIVLHKELHHRVKNNLSIIDTFIEVTKDEIQDVQSNSRLTELQNRISSIYKVHEQLYKNDNVTHIYLNTYIQDILKNLQNSLPQHHHISTHIDIQEGVTLLPSNAIPIGLIINEFVTNSYKYAFDLHNKGDIEVGFRESKNNYTLILKDNGKGLPNKFDIDTTVSFGIRVMRLLTEQLQGEFMLNGENGVHLTIVFPNT